MTLLVLFLMVGMVLAAETATILVDDLNVRSGPGTTHAVVFKLAEKSRVHVLSRSQEWLKIEFSGRQGYILDDPRFVDRQAASAASARPSSDKGELKDLHRQAEKIEEQLKASRNQMESMTRKEHGVLNEVNAAEEALESARREVRDAQAEMDALQKKAADIQQRYTLFEKEIKAGEAYAAQRLVAVYKLNWMGRIQLLASANSFFEFVQRKSALERILSQDEALLEKLRTDQAALEALLEQLNASQTQKKASELALNQRIAALDAEQQRRGQLLKKIRSEKELERASLLALREAAQELDKTIAALAVVPATPVPAPERPAAPETGALPETALSAGSRFVFESHKGLLDWPVRGKIVSTFGPYTDQKSNLVNFQSGINIQAERGEPIRAVAEGHAIFANWFKGFGNMLIIDHGNHYYTVYAHLEELFKVKGDRVEKAEVVATVGDSGSLSGPALHFEVRHHGKPVDPMKWIRKG
ncbi:MAG: peptidoglycan DD-metalloendopeptidase family protein [Desulfatitalea sp.]|nr:peptidoglycan DD-metalloendopeptidase family protein [Desulfatitalea sp.]